MSKRTGAIKMRLVSAMIAIFALSACQSASRDLSQTDAALEQAKAEITKLEQENEKLKAASAPKAKPRKPKPPAPKTGLDEYDPEIADNETTTPSPKLCWQDYCPCEPGQDGQGMEASLCRNLKGGVHVDDNVMAAAAMARDARRQIREFNKQNPDF